MVGLPLDDNKQALTQPTALLNFREMFLGERVVVKRKLAVELKVEWKEAPITLVTNPFAVNISYTDMRLAASILSAVRVKPLLHSCMSYNHGRVALSSTIVDMAQDYEMETRLKGQSVKHDATVDLLSRLRCTVIKDLRRKNKDFEIELIGTQGLLERKERQLRKLCEFHEKAMQKKKDFVIDLQGLLERQERQIEEYYKKQVHIEELCANLMDELSIAQKKLEVADEKTSCQICCSRHKAWARTACGHMFCRECLDKLSGKPCAFCRADDSGCVRVHM